MDYTSLGLILTALLGMFQITKNIESRKLLGAEKRRVMLLELQKRLVEAKLIYERSINVANSSAWNDSHRNRLHASIKSLKVQIDNFSKAIELLNGLPKLNDPILMEELYTQATQIEQFCKDSQANLDEAEVAIKNSYEMTAKFAI